MTGRTEQRFIRLSPILLSVAILQTGDCETKNFPELDELEIEAAGANQIGDFSPDTRLYQVGTQASEVVVHAVANDPEAVVTYRVEYTDPILGPGLWSSGLIGVGGGEVTTEIPPGRSTLIIAVARLDLEGRYTIRIARGGVYSCSEGGVLQAVARGGGLHAFDCDGPTTVVMRTDAVVSRDVALDGRGDLTLQSNGAARLFTVEPGTSLELEGIELTNGRAELGGALFVEGRAKLVDSRLVANRATYRGGAIYGSPGSELVLEGVTVEDNEATSGTSEAAGGGLYLADCSALIKDSVIQANTARGRSSSTGSGRRARGGGVFGLNADLVVETSQVVDNSAFGGDGGGDLSTAGYAFGGGFHLESSTLTIADSSVSRNTARGGYAYRGGGSGSGGGIRIDQSVVAATGTTIAGNVAQGVTGPWEAGSGGGVVAGFDSVFIATNSTITGNRADYGEGLLSDDAVIELYNSTIADNSSDESSSSLLFYSGTVVTIGHSIVASGGRCVGGVSSTGYNLFDPSFTCGVVDGPPTDQFDVDPGLEPLADNGGPTMTHGLSESSPARDGGDPAGCLGEDGEPLTRDQRGATRPVGVCDVGAIETQ